MDVTNPEDMDAFEDVLARLHPNIRMLFQSAGEGLHGRFDSMKRQDETEMVIRILSFGSAIKVVEPESFTSLLLDRIEKQKQLATFSPGTNDALGV